MISTAEFHNGLRIEIEGIPYVIVEFQHVKPGKGGAFVRTKLRNLQNNLVVDKTFRSGEKVDNPNIEEKETQFLYANGSSYCFMDKKNYEQFELTEKHLGDNKNFLKENMDIKIQYHRGNPIGVTLPIFENFKIVSTDPPLRGATASGGSKPAQIDTGVTIKVPQYIQEGDMVKVDTRSGEFIERVKG